MTGELKKRIAVTFALLFTARALIHLPVPGIDASLIEFAGAWSRTVVGALGLMPYFGASALVILVLYFLRFRRGVDDRDLPVELYTLGLAGVIALLQSYGIAIFLENFSSASGPVVPNPGWGFRFTTMLSQTAGTFLLIWLAHQISQKGIGNGVCLITLSLLLENAVPALFDLGAKLKILLLNTDTTFVQFIIILFLVVMSFGAMLTLINARWQPSLQRFETNEINSSTLHLRVNGVGIIGLTVAQSLLFIPATLASFLPSSFPGRQFLERIEPANAMFWILWSLLVFAVTYFGTAWAYRPGGLQAIFRKRYNTESAWPENEFERRLAIVTLLPAFGLPLIAGVFFWLAQKTSFHVLSASLLFPVAAIALDLFRQFKIHRQMAAAFVDAQKESVCGECHAGASAEDRFCPTCGIAFAENLSCDTHSAAAALAHCVICQKQLCEDCGVVTQDRYVCEAHSEVELIEGWATALMTTTRLEAELGRQHLEKLGIPALVLSNTIEPQYGTLGVFEVNPVTPFFIYRELGGGRIRLMTPAHAFIQAQDYLASLEELDALSHADRIGK